MNILYTILIFMAIGFLVFYILPALLPVLLILFVFSMIRNIFIRKKQEKFFEETFSNRSQDSQYTRSQTKNNTSNPDVIDVEYTEREDED